MENGRSKDARERVPEAPHWHWHFFCQTVRTHSYLLSSGMPLCGDSGESDSDRSSVSGLFRSSGAETENLWKRLQFFVDAVNVMPSPTPNTQIRPLRDHHPSRLGPKKTADASALLGWQLALLLASKRLQKPAAVAATAQKVGEEFTVATHRVL